MEHIDIRREELKELLERAREVLAEEDYRKLKAAVDALSYLTDLVADKDTTIRDLRQLLLPQSTEKTREVLEKLGIALGSDTQENSNETGQPKEKAAKKPGHGRHAASEYPGAAKVEVNHAAMQAGDRCPECHKGKVYEQQEPKVLVRIVGQAPIHATVL